MLPPSPIICFSHRPKTTRRPDANAPSSYSPHDHARRLPATVHPGSHKLPRPRHCSSSTSSAPQQHRLAGPVCHRELLLPSRSTTPRSLHDLAEAEPRAVVLVRAPFLTSRLRLHRYCRSLARLALTGARQRKKQPRRPQSELQRRKSKNGAPQRRARQPSLAKRRKRGSLKVAAGKQAPAPKGSLTPQLGSLTEVSPRGKTRAPQPLRALAR